MPPPGVTASQSEKIDRSAQPTTTRHPLTITPFVSFNPHRKKKALHKTTSTDDKRLTNTLKRLGVNVIPGIEEVNIFKDDDVVHFTNPKVQASIAANTYVVSGPNETKALADMMPAIMNQLGDMTEALKTAGGDIEDADGDDDDDDDDDIPDLVENFEEVSEK